MSFLTLRGAVVSRHDFASSSFCSLVALSSSWPRKIIFLGRVHQQRSPHRVSSCCWFFCAPARFSRFFIYSQVNAHAVVSSARFVSLCSRRFALKVVQPPQRVFRSFAPTPIRGPRRHSQLSHFPSRALRAGPPANSGMSFLQFIPLFCFIYYDPSLALP